MQTLKSFPKRAPISLVSQSEFKTKLTSADQFWGPKFRNEGNILVNGTENMCVSRQFHHASTLNFSPYASSLTHPGKNFGRDSREFYEIEIAFAASHSPLAASPTVSQPPRRETFFGRRQASEEKKKKEEEKREKKLLLKIITDISQNLRLMDGSYSRRQLVPFGIRSVASSLYLSSFHTQLIISFHFPLIFQLNILHL